MDENYRECPRCGKWFNKYGLANHVAQGHDGRINNPNLGRWVEENLKNPSAKFSKFRARGSRGGLRRGAGRGKKGWYAGYWCDSSWELAWVIYAIDHLIDFKRNNQFFTYEYDGKIRKFYPDFELASGDMVEIKGYMDPRNEAKILAVPKLKVLGEREITPFLEYVTNKLGRDFASIAYQSEPEYRCCDCQKPISRGYERCQKCACADCASYKIDWPPISDLLMMVSGRRYEHTARVLGVSSNAIRKRMKKFGQLDEMEKSSV